MGSDRPNAPKEVSVTMQSSFAAASDWTAAGGHVPPPPRDQRGQVDRRSMGQGTGEDSPRNPKLSMLQCKLTKLARDVKLRIFFIHPAL
jgi:hypothetical protein